MLFLQEKIAYIWLLPVMVYIVLPLTILLIKSIMDVLRNQNNQSVPKSIN